MSASSSENLPWPAQTPAPPPLPPYKRSKRKRSPTSPLPRGSSSKLARQSPSSQQVEQAKTQCEIDSGNEIISCFPTQNTIIPQHEWASFVWNSRRPEITQTNLVDIFLFDANSLTPLLHYPNQKNPPNQAGIVTAQVNDTWWGSKGVDWNGSNISYPFYWVLIRSGDELDGSEIPQSVFHAVQTTFADSVVASMASTSAAAASASSVSAASAASLSSLRSSRTVAVSPTSGSNGVQSNGGDSSFPHWAIAVIVVLGFLAITAACILAFLIIRRIRRRNEIESNRNSMGSASPMMANIGTNNPPQSPILAPAIAPRRQPSSIHPAPSVVSPDGASTISRANSAGDAGPFSGADAAIMADAFRKALRKPDFASQPVEEGDSPNSQERKEQKEELLSRELAEEGRDIRSVSSSRGVRVETLSDSGDTVQDN